MSTCCRFGRLPILNGFWVPFLLYGRNTRLPVLKISFLWISRLGRQAVISLITTNQIRSFTKASLGGVLSISNLSIPTSTVSLGPWSSIQYQIDKSASLLCSSRELFIQFLSGTSVLVNFGRDYSLWRIAVLSWARYHDVRVAAGGERSLTCNFSE